MQLDSHLKKIRALVTDVDGVLTNGAIVVSAAGETKFFDVRDGLAIKLLQSAGIPVAILSGRRSEPVVMRARELGIDVVKTGRVDKQTALSEISESMGIPAEAMAYIGDDLPDLAPLSLAGVGFCPADAAEEVRHAADFIVPLRGGEGVLRFVAEKLLKAQGKWADMVASFEVKS